MTVKKNKLYISFQPHHTINYFPKKNEQCFRFFLISQSHSCSAFHFCFIHFSFCFLSFSYEFRTSFFSIITRTKFEISEIRQSSPAHSFSQFAKAKRSQNSIHPFGVHVSTFFTPHFLSSFLFVHSFDLLFLFSFSFFFCYFTTSSNRITK